MGHKLPLLHCPTLGQNQILAAEDLLVALVRQGLKAQLVVLAQQEQLEGVDGTDVGGPEGTVGAATTDWYVAVKLS